MLKVRRLLAVCGVLVSLSLGSMAQVAGQNINMVSGTDWPAGDPFLQRQNEPSIAVSSRNPEHLVGGANDYRTVDIPNPQAPSILGDAWLGVYTSLDGGETWKSTLLPGYPQDTSAVGKASPLYRKYTVATDPTVRAGTHGLFYYSGLAFNRATNSPSAVFVSVFQDQNNKGNGNAPLLVTDGSGTHGNPFKYINTTLVHTANQRQFLDKPWIVVDIPRPGRTASCKINGQSFQSGYVYVFYTVFTNSGQTNQHSSIMEVRSTNCGATWSSPQTLNDDTRQNQGTVASIDPRTGAIFATWRALAYRGMPDSIQYAWSPDGWFWGNGITDGLVYQFGAATSTTGPFDQNQNNATFRTLDIPTTAIDTSGRIWVAFSLREPGPNGTAGSRVVLTTQSFPMGPWTKPYVADSTSWSNGVATTYGHQFMPSLNFAYGKLMLAWMDTRRDNLQSVLACPSGTCTGLADLKPQDVPIPGSTVSNPSTVFTANISDPNSGVRHTMDVFGGMITPAYGQTFKGVQISQYGYWVDPATNNQIEQAFFNPPNLPMFVQGTTPFVGDYLDIAAQSIMPSGSSWVLNTQATDPNTGATSAPDFHIAWTDNRDVVPPPVVGGIQDWTQYVPPNSGASQTSVYSASGAACPGCTITQPACTNVVADGGGVSSYSGDRNQNVYTSRITNGLVVRFKENAKPLSAAVQRSFSLLVKNTMPPLSTTPLGAPSFYRILLGATSTTQAPSCTVTGGTATLPGTPNCYLDVAVNPNTVLTQPITLTSTSATASLNVLVAQIQAIPPAGIAPTYTGLQAVAVLNGDPTNPAVADPDFLTADNSNPDVSTPYGNLPIAAGEEYDPTVNGPADPSSQIFTPKIGTPAIFTPKIGTVANNSPAIQTPSVFTPKIGNEIASVQIVNPTIVNTIFTPKINSPQIFTPKIVSPDIFTPKITSLTDGGITDYTWLVTNKGNTSASYSTQEFTKAAGVACCPASCSANPNSCSVTADNPAGPNCSVCQLIQHKVYESPAANRDSSTGNPTCDLNVQQSYTTVANITDPAFSTGGAGGNSAADPTKPTLALGPGEGNRVTLRVVAPPVTQTVAPFKTVASSFVPDKGQSAPATSLTITTSVLPVAVVGQNYTGATALAIGGLGAQAWSVPADPSNPVAATLPITPKPIVSGLPITLSQSGQLSTALVPFGTGTGAYTANLQVQDAATHPALDVQQVPLLVNQLTIASVNLQIGNQVGTTGYINAGDVANLTVTINNQGPAIATSVTPVLTVNTVAAGNPSGPQPSLACSGPVGATQISGNSAGLFTYTCNNASGNGYVTFSVTAKGAYVNGAGSVTATATDPNNNNATSVTEPGATPSGTPPNAVIDTVNPTLAFANASPAANQYGWNNTPVTFNYTTNDNLSGVNTSVPNPLVLSTEGKNLSGSVKVTDWAKNSATFTAPTSSMPAVNIDLTAPRITASSTYTPNVWTNQNVTVVFTCSDNLSGPIYTSGLKNPVISGVPANGASVVYSQTNALTSVATVTLTAETAGTTLSAACQDLAGNNAMPVQFGQILIDKTLPQLTVTAITPKGAYTAGMWTNQNVTITYSCSDNASPVNANSGVATGSPNPAQQLFTTETTGTPSSATCRDVAGNQTSLSFGQVLIDKTPPVMAVSAVTSAGPYTAGTWTNKSVIVSYTCADNASPVGANSSVAAGSPTPASQVFSTETAGSTSNATCMDVAGNQASATFSPIQIDLTPPVLTVAATTPSGPYTAGTWTNQTVTVAYACTDAASAVANSGVLAGYPQGSSVFSTDTSSGSTGGACVDAAGNAATPLPFGPVQVDKTPPVLTVAATTPNGPYTADSWTNQPVTVTYSCTDSGGGVASGYPKGSQTFTAETSNGSATGTCVDAAGNAATPLPFSPVKIDLTPPTVTPTAMLAGGGTYTAGTWTNQSVLVSFACSDSLSGVQPGSVSGNSAYTSQGSYTANGSCQDLAGNVGNGSFGPVLIDTTTPSVMITSPQAQAYILNQQITPSFTCPDSGGDNATCTAMPSASAYTASAVGPAAFSVHAVDDAGNATNPDPSVNYLVIYNFTGFQAPLQPAVFLNQPNPPAPPQITDSGSFVIGNTIPIAWQLQDAANTAIADLKSLTSIVAIANPTCTGVVSGPGSTLYDSQTGQSAFSYDSESNRFLFNWDTTSFSAGCYNLVVTTNDTAQWSTMVHLAADKFSGFDAPLTTSGTVSAPSSSGTFDTGATIPVMWQLQLPNGQPDLSQAVSAKNVTVYPNTACTGPAATGAAGTVLFDPASETGTIAFEPSTAVYTVIWPSAGLSDGCYDVVVTLSDSSTHATRVTLSSAAPLTTLVQYNFDNVPQGAASQTAPASYAAPNFTPDVFGYSRNSSNGMGAIGCDIALCIDPAGVVQNEYYSFSFTSSDVVSQASISFSGFNNDCQVNNNPCNGQSFTIQYSTGADFSNPVTVVAYNPTEPGSQKYSFPISGTLPPATYYFRVVATGNNSDGTAQYVLDDVTVNGMHTAPPHP